MTELASYLVRFFRFKLICCLFIKQTRAVCHSYWISIVSHDHVAYRLRLPREQNWLAKQHNTAIGSSVRIGCGT